MPDSTNTIKDTHWENALTYDIRSLISLNQPSIRGYYP